MPDPGREVSSAGSIDLTASPLGSSVQPSGPLATVSTHATSPSTRRPPENVSVMVRGQ